MIETLKGTVLRDRFRKCWRKLIDLGLNKGRGWFLNFSEAHLILVEIKHILSGKCQNDADSLCNPIIFVPILPASLSYWGIRNQSEAASVLCKPIGEKLWPISEHRENCNSLSACYLHISKYHLAHRRPNTRFNGACKTYANFFCLILILRQFRIIRCKRQAALHSALFNYTPLVIRGTSKNKQLTIIKPTQTGINRNK